MIEGFHQLGLMGWPLALCSFTMVTICLERAVFFASAYWKKDESYQLLVAQLTKYKDQPKTTRDEIATLLLEELQKNYYSGLTLLRMIGVISPMLGLLGTILGIIKAFQAIAAHAGPVSPSLIADGLWEAMLTTAVGLAIALPALLLAYLFRALGEKMADQFCVELNKLSLSFETGEAVP